MVSHGSLGWHWGGKTRWLGLSEPVQTVREKCLICRGFERAFLQKMSAAVGRCPDPNIEASSMIDGEGVRLAATAATLDDLFRRAGVRHPHTLTLADPPNRDAFVWGAPRKLSFAQADRAISACAARLRCLGLQTDSIVAMHLPNTVESIIAFLGVLRAGMVAVPLPLLWRKAEITSALGRVGAKAIVTCSRIGTDAQAEIAMQSAADLFSVRHVCGFGHGLPDGLVSLDDIFSSDGIVAVSPRIGRDTSVAAITFNLDGAGFVPISRSHVELVAGGLEIVRATGAAADAPVLSTIPITSFAGIALTMMPWLLCGGALHLHHAFETEAFAAQCRERSPRGPSYCQRLLFPRLRRWA